MSRWLVTGAGGMLGQDLVAVLRERPDISLSAPDRAALDITDSGAVAAAVRGHDIVVNAAAWTDVDGAEAAEDRATAVNGHAVAHLARACAASGARLLQVSTDYVFPGDAKTPYSEEAPTTPVNAYGRGKLVGEHAVLDLHPGAGYVVRTAWLYSDHGRNFFTTMLRLAAEREVLSVVDDQTGQPTWSYALAARLVELGDAALAGRAPVGVYHATSTGSTTWLGFARAIFARAGLPPERIRPTTTAQFPRPAPRPAFSVLGHDRWSRAGLDPLAPWEQMLDAACARYGFAPPVPSAAARSER
jgi:dTDP-4-dehydrorhamnose reductase